MAKKAKKTVRRSVKRTVSQKKCCSFKPLAWLAGILGVLVIVGIGGLKLMQSQPVEEEAQIFEVSPGAEIVKEWTFTTGLEGWLGMREKLIKVCIRRYPNHECAEYRGSSRSDENTPDDLVAENGWLKIENASINHYHYLFNTGLGIDVSQDTGDLVIEVKMKATQPVGYPLNKAKLEIVNVIPNKGLSKTVMPNPVGSDGGLYTFRFTRAELNSDAAKYMGKGKVGKITFWPSVGVGHVEGTKQVNSAKAISNVMIDRITVYSD